MWTYKPTLQEDEESLCHYGILGMKWGVRRYQNLDGTLTEAGKKHYRGNTDKQYSDYKKLRQRTQNKLEKQFKKDPSKLTDDELAMITARKQAEANLASKYPQKKKPGIDISRAASEAGQQLAKNGILLGAGALMKALGMDPKMAVDLTGKSSLSPEKKTAAQIQKEQAEEAKAQYDAAYYREKKQSVGDLVLSEVVKARTQAANSGKGGNNNNNNSNPFADMTDEEITDAILAYNADTVVTPDLISTVRNLQR